MSRAPASFARHLLARLGPGAAAPAALESRARAHRTLAYAAVVAPPDAEAVAETLRLCTEEGWPVQAAGGATWLGAYPGSDRQEPPVVISTARLDRVIEHEPADLVIGVEAGVSLAALASRLTGQGQWLPLDPPAVAPATIGAVVALGSAGPLRAGHGTPRDLALGIRIATGDGRLLHFGGRVVKNVAGYDGVRLVVGSGGTLGIITEVYLRVRGAPRDDRTVLVRLGERTGAARRGAELALEIRDQVGCDALELLGPRVAAGMGIGPGWSLLARLAGGEAAVLEGVERLKWLAERASRAVGGAVSDVSGEVWERLAELEADADTALRLTGLPTTLAAAADALEEAFSDWHCAAHAADGVIRLWLPEVSAHEADARLAGADLPGDWTVRYDRAPAGVASPAAARSAAVTELTRRIRAAFDPAGVLVGGGAR